MEERSHGVGNGSATGYRRPADQAHRQVQGVAGQGRQRGVGRPGWTM